MEQKPYSRFLELYQKAQESESSYHDAFSLSTLNSEGQPSSRTVLLKVQQEDEFTFFTNYNSKKAQELLANPKASMLFYWKSLKVQVRIQGEFIKSDKKTSDDYWNSRPYESQLYSYASKQSRPLDQTEEELQKTFETIKKEHPLAIPRPDHWGGFTLKAQSYEFWKEGDFRWHQRDLYQLDPSDSMAWTKTRLYP